ncbi:hypothetical protein CJA_3765 [Cellvibrio japonicus Ueda107]|uniref:Uncharacterized protein n=1 Tax=Cellvibrio japonicus (strain Ueda107) TaxID=498211 RepID=B3PIN2_CELJU|nr:hypothetical protein CJA_3765 [Cellvibrio japonicus Ueda107]
MKAGFFNGFFTEKRLLACALLAYFFKFSIAISAPKNHLLKYFYL